MSVRRIALLLPAVALLAGAGCRAGTVPPELEQLRVRASTLEAENAHMQGQLSLVEAERDQLRQQVNDLTTELAGATAQVPPTVAYVVSGENLVVMPSTVKPGEWVAVFIKNYPARLLPMAGVALRGGTGQNLAHIKQLASANLFLLPVPPDVAPGLYQIVLGEAGELGPSAKLDDQVTITIRER